VSPSLGPLAGLRVLDFSHAAAGPYTTMLLGDLGADVIKIERPGRGDGSRFMGEPIEDANYSDYYFALNRNKRDVLIDLSKPAGAGLALQLVAVSDIVVQNFRPGVMERLGLGFEQVRALKRGLIYASISAFGSEGPWRERPGNDIILQSVSGLMGITGEVDGGPVRIGAPVSDFSAGLFALVGILAALHKVEENPRGQHIKVSMLEASLALMCSYIPKAARGVRIPRLGRGHAQIVPYQAFVCSDGEYLMVGAFTNGFWRHLCEAIGRPELAKDPRFATNADRLANRKLLIPELVQIFAARPIHEWSKVLDDADVPNSPVLELRDAVQTEQVRHAGTIYEVGHGNRLHHMTRFPVRVPGWSTDKDLPAPYMGEHTRAVLAETLGLNQESIATLEADGVIA